MNEKSSGGGGIGFVGLLTIVFITLKLTHVIAWSWWWVLSPLWISVAVVALIGVIAVFVALLRKMTRVTNHAARRTKERLGLPKKLSHKNAANALRYGIRHSDTSGSLNRYISALYWKHETANNVRIYCNNVYIFHGETLITIFSAAAEIPQNCGADQSENHRTR